MNLSKSAFLFVILITFLITSCKKSAIDESKIEYKKFTNYITGYSQSPVSRCDDVFVKLGFQLPEGYILPSGLFEISPPIGGNYQLTSSGKQIRIKNADIKHNVEYNVKFNVGMLTEMPIDMQSFSFPLEAQTQTWDITMDPPVNKSMEKVSYSGVVKFGVCEPRPQVLENSLIARQGDKKLNITWTHQKNNKRRSQFTIHNIERREDPDFVNVELSMEAINVKDKADLRLAIPSTSDFSFHNYRIVNNNHLKITFTDPLQKNQKIDGLINVKGRIITQTKINNNHVEVYFKNENYGYFDLSISPGIKNMAGFPLRDTYTKELFFTPPKPKVKIAEKGNILPPGNRWELPVSLVSANGFRLRILKIYDHNIPRFYQENAEPYVSQRGLENIGRLALDTIITIDKKRPFIDSYHSIALDRVIKKETGALYKVILTIPNENNLYPCPQSQGTDRRDHIDAIDFDKPWVRIRYDYDYYEDDYYYRNYYNNNLGSQHYSDQYQNETYKNPCDLSYDSDILDARLLMCSDVGLVAKYEPEKNSFFIYSSSISKADPISNASITLYNIQGKEIAAGYTDGSGMADIPLPDQKAFLAKATYNNQTTYLPVQDAKALSLSTFQVEGKNWDGATKVFFYGDRDVWRPGDTVHMNTIVYSPDNILPERLPVALKLYDPTNKLVKEWTVKNNSNGIYDCQFVTDINDPTGYWRLLFKMGGKVHKQSVRIETIRPNRLKMEMAFANEKIVKHTDPKTAPVSVKWMHGLEAKGLRTEIYMLQKVLTNPFGADYTNYIFNDLRKEKQSDIGIVKDEVTNSKGVLNFDIPTDADDSYPSMMQFNFELRSFEKGGAFSSDMKAIKYSPYSHYIGAKFPGGDNGTEIYIKDNEAVILAALDQNGQEAQREVQVKLYKIDHNWWYQFGASGNYAALTNYTTSKLKDYSMTIGKEGGTLSFKDYGRFLLEVKDIKSGHSISRVIYSYSNQWREDNQEVSQLEVLPLLIEKTDYKVGDNLSFELPAMSNGRFLVTVENGGRILYKKIVKGSSLPIAMQIPVTSKMAPTAYVHVHLIQAWESHKNDRPLRLFGIKPIKVYDPSTILKPELDMPDELKTDESFTVQISEADNRSMSYTLAIVDEGLLDITQFKTPNPWALFFGKESLNVKTWDMYRQIFQRFLGEYTSLLAVGGDGSAAIKPTAKARRFKPVVKHIGPFKLNAGETRSHKFTINDYAGSVRAMIVATDGSALGRYEKTVPVTKPLMLYATLPRVLGPKEKMKLPVTVFTMQDDIKKVTATVKASDAIKVLGSSTQEIIFDKKGEKDIFFEIETGTTIGVTEVIVEVISGSYQYKETINIDLRPSAPLISKSFSSMVSAGQTKGIEYKSVGMEGTNTGQVTVSKGLNFSFAPQVQWLSNYPHGCLEQTISRIFPQIYLYKMNLLDDVDQLKYRQQYKAAIQKLRFLQMPNGGFSYWPGGNRANEWGTSYTFQFLLEAKKYGYEVPESMIKKCIDYQYKASENIDIISSNNNRTTSDYRTIGYAYRLYTLAQARKPNYAAMNRLRLLPNLHNTARWILAHSFTILGEESLAKAMIDSATATVSDYRELGGNFGSGLRDQAIIARVLIDSGDKLKAKVLIDEMIANFDADKVSQLSTQDRAQSLITFAKFVSSLDKVEDSIKYDIILSDTQQLLDVEIDEKPQSYDLDEDAITQSKISVTNKGESELYTSVVISGQPLRDDTQAEANDLSLEILYTDLEGKILKPQEITKGTDFVIQYSVKHTGVRDDYENMALTGIFPSGWEILNQRLKEDSSFDEGSVADYQDIRDDRVHLYFDLKKNEKKMFRFKMNATYEGKYWAAPAFCEAMYDARIRAKTKGFWAVVK